jgi:hypothetical protein
VPVEDGLYLPERELPHLGGDPRGEEHQGPHDRPEDGDVDLTLEKTQRINKSTIYYGNKMKSKDFKKKSIQLNSNLPHVL